MLYNSIIYFIKSENIIGFQKQIKLTKNPEQQSFVWTHQSNIIMSIIFSKLLFNNMIIMRDLWTKYKNKKLIKLSRPKY